MNPTLTCILLLLSSSGTLSKYVHVDKIWYRDPSLSYCRQYYTDLAPVNNERDIAELRKIKNDTGYILIGLERSSTDTNKWMWSGGGQVTRAIVVGEEKTWEEALEYCREHHDDLASVASETEMMLIQRELRKHNTTEHVWIGLRFLSRDWLWVDGQEMDYEAWGEGGKPLCPHPKMKCGALQSKEGERKEGNVRRKYKVRKNQFMPHNILHLTVFTPSCGPQFLSLQFRSTPKRQRKQ
ncbi:myosin heavy chain 1/2/3/4/8/13/7B/15 [Sarotherodon galilaeus]